jgi:hypothetical protein
MTDYFETDRIYVQPSHPLYAAVKAAFDQKVARWAAQQAKREAAYAARRAASAAPCDASDKRPPYAIF